MKKIIGSASFLMMLLCLTSLAVAMGSKPEPPKQTPVPNDFIFDGCSVVPEGYPWDPNQEYLWCECCIDHDIAYWRGGTWVDRRLADAQLGQCVQEKTGIPELGAAFFLGTEIGGSPYWKQPYRWGYAWSDGRNYQINTDEENILLDEALSRWEDKMDGLSCEDRIEDF